MPEQKARIEAEEYKRSLHDRPTLTEDSREDINRVITESMYIGSAATFTLYDPLKDYELTGAVKMIDLQLRRLKLEHDGEVTWLPHEDVLKACMA
ncbi:MAG: hypothetical protein JWM44_1312 [Bacilli bacterium]|nr:hypothetical protein [Bacilli bacterium]